MNVVSLYHYFFLVTGYINHF